jgi:hypothetical protein
MPNSVIRIGHRLSQYTIATASNPDCELCGYRRFRMARSRRRLAVLSDSDKDGISDAELYGVLTDRVFKEIEALLRGRAKTSTSNSTICHSVCKSRWKSHEDQSQVVAGQVLPRWRHRR